MVARSCAGEVYIASDEQNLLPTRAARFAKQCCWVSLGSGVPVTVLGTAIQRLFAQFFIVRKVPRLSKGSSLVTSVRSMT